MADLLYKVKEPGKANELISNTATYVEDQLNYLSAIAKTKENLNAREIQLGLFVMGEMIKLTQQNGQIELNKKLQARYSSMDSKFMGGR